MPSTLANFTLSAAAAADDFIVGYDEAVLNGERRWTVSTISNAVSGVMNTQLNNLINSKTSTAVLSASLSASPISAKAWVNFNGTTNPPTIRSSYNVSSVTKNGTGSYTVNFASNLTDANYSVCGCTINNGTMSVQIEGIFSVAPTLKTTSAVRISTASVAVLYDCVDVSIVIFGN